MQIHDAHSKGKSTTPNEDDNLVQCRLTMVDLHANAIKREYSEAFDEIKRRCMSCSFRASCAAEVMRDPYNLIWEAYCPSSGALNALVALTEVIH
jgi:hypothetical protein